MNTLHLLRSYLRPYRWLVIGGPLLMVLEVVMDLLQPRLMQTLLDEALPAGDLGAVARLGLAMLGAALVGAVGGIGNTVAAVRVAQGFGADLRASLFRKVQSLSFGNLDELGTGGLVTRLTNDVTQVQEVVLIVLRIMVRGPLMLLGALAMAVFTSRSLALMLLVLAPAVLGFVYWMVRRSQPLFAGIQQRLDRLNTVIQENLTGVRLVRAFARAPQEEARFGAANEELTGRTVEAMRLMAVGMPFMMTTTNLGVLGALWLGGRAVAADTMHIGQVIAFINYLLIVLRELMMVSFLAMRIARAEASAQRLQEVSRSEPEIRDAPGAARPARLAGRVEFRGVSFDYHGRAHAPVLAGIHLAAAPGEIVGIVGGTGAGKSSLVHLIPRFYDVTAGQVRIDGLDVRTIAQDVLHRHVAVALQEAVLFSGTVRDNIAYGRPEATDEEVEAAARAAAAHEFILALPGQYQAEIGQRGVNLSGGQKQRLAIARALLVQPAILILDDSTSAVDVETEARIRSTLRQRHAGQTRFIVAQRLSTVMHADRIAVLDEGRLLDVGTHAELLARCQVYREIHASQLGNGAGDERA